MALQIFTNIVTQNAQRNLTVNNSRLESSIRQVASGQRLQKAGDDSASFSISQSIRSDNLVLRQASRNANDAISLVNTVEGSIGEVSSILIRLRELSQQSASGTISDTDRESVQLEFSQLREELDRIANTTEFNGQKLLEGSLSNGASNPSIIQTGLDGSTANRFNLNEILDVSDLRSATTGLDQLAVNTQEGALAASGAIEALIDDIIESRSRVAVASERLASTVSYLDRSVEENTRADSILTDADLGEGFADLTRNQILVQASTAMVGQANLNPQSVFEALVSTII
jgi:flagellin